MSHLIKAVIKKIIKETNLLRPLNASAEEIEAVYNFHLHYPDHRSLTTCAAATKIPISKCARIKKRLYRQRRLGLYYFQADTPPQRFMKSHILKHNPQISAASLILEVGPGENPIFPYEDYPHWFGVDKYLAAGTINFKDNRWAKNKYPENKILAGQFENLSQIAGLREMVGRFDLVVACHSYEHVLEPIKSLREAAAMLRPGGQLIIFAPDGYSDDINTKDPTHTIYLNPEMVQEFFAAAGGFKDISVSDYRPNADLIITATKI